MMRFTKFLGANTVFNTGRFFSSMPLSYGCKPEKSPVETIYWCKNLKDCLDFIKAHRKESQQLFQIYSKQGNEDAIRVMGYEEFSSLLELSKDEPSEEPSNDSLPGFVKR